MKKYSYTALILMLALPFVAACDVTNTRETRVQNSSGTTLDLVIRKDIDMNDSSTLQKFQDIQGCGLNYQEIPLGNGILRCISTCPLGDGSAFTLNLNEFYGSYIPKRKPNEADLRNWQVCDSFYIGNKTLLKDPKILDNWMYKTKKVYTTATFNIMPSDIQ